jgi:hypothetical protein
MMTINGWLFCSLPTAPPPPKLASCSCASHAPACRVSRPSRSLSMLCGAFISNGNGWPLWPLMVVTKVFNFGNKKISELTEKWEIPEISAQIQIEFNFFKKN